MVLHTQIGIRNRFLLNHTSALKKGRVRRPSSKSFMVKNWFNLSAGVILLITGTGKILSTLGHAAILQRVDPIFPIQFNHLMLTVGILELLVACICFFNKLRI